MTVLVGHRGAPLAAVENTVPSLMAAARQGAWGVEFDVRSTADGEPILLHDRTFQRFWSNPAAPAELTLEQVRRLRCDLDSGLSIPTITEAARSVTVQLVVDGKEPALVPRIVTDLESAGALDRAWFIGEPVVLAAVRQVLPDARIVMSWSHAEPPPDELTAQVGPFAVNLPWALVSSATIGWIRALGMKVWSYCIDTADDVARARDLGVDGVVSNDPAAISAATAQAGSARAGHG